MLTFVKLVFFAATFKNTEVGIKNLNLSSGPVPDNHDPF